MPTIRRWRGWDLAALVLVSVAAAGAVGHLVRMPGPGHRIGYGLAGALYLWFVGRALLGRVTVEPDGVRLRGVLRTTTVPWTEVAGVELRPLTGFGPLRGGRLIVSRRAGPHDAPRDERSSVIGWRTAGGRSTAAERAHAELQVSWRRWQARQVSSSPADGRPAGATRRPPVARTP
jgi:hypothetical protein